MFIEIPTEWISNPPNKATIQVWFAISSTASILSISEICLATGICSRVASRALQKLSSNGLGLVYFPGKGKTQSRYEVIDPGVLFSTHLRIKQYALESNDFNGLSSGAYQTVRTEGDMENPSRARSIANNINSSIDNLTKDNINSINKTNNKGGKIAKAVPYKQILNLFDEIIVSQYPIIGYVEINRQAPKKYGGSSKKSLADSELGIAISDQWKKVKSIDWFRDYFERAVKDCLDISPWHRGEVDDFRISLWWLLKRKKAQDKIFNKKYWEDKELFDSKKQQKTTPDFFPDEDESKIIDIEVGNKQWQR